MAIKAQIITGLSLALPSNSSSSSSSNRLCILKTSFFNGGGKPNSYSHSFTFWVLFVFLSWCQFRCLVAEKMRERVRKESESLMICGCSCLIALIILVLFDGGFVIVIIVQRIYSLLAFS